MYCTHCTHISVVQGYNNVSMHNQFDSFTFGASITGKVSFLFRKIYFGGCPGLCKAVSDVPLTV